MTLEVKCKQCVRSVCFYVVRVCVSEKLVGQGCVIVTITAVGRDQGSDTQVHTQNTYWTHRVLLDKPKKPIS